LIPVPIVGAETLCQDAVQVGVGIGVLVGGRTGVGGLVGISVGVAVGLGVDVGVGVAFPRLDVTAWAGRAPYRTSPMTDRATMTCTESRLLRCILTSVRSSTSVGVLTLSVSSQPKERVRIFLKKQ
jgi:hypothetical protein